MIPMHQYKSFFGLSWNPFLPDIPISAFCLEEQVTQFCWNVEQLVLDGGFAFVTGDPGAGKSITLRVLQNRLSQIPDLSVRVLSRPQSRLRDFYREMAAIFGIEMRFHNRFGGFLKLREQWLSHIHSNLFRPVLLIDEAQELPDEVLSEIRLLGSADLDARSILAVIFAGDKRFLSNLSSPAIAPLESRMRVRLHLQNRSPESMRNILMTTLKNAGNSDLMSPGVIRALSEQHLGNIRAMMISANQLLSIAFQKEIRQIDENLYFEVASGSAKKKK